MAQCASLPTVGGCVLEGSSAAVQPTAVGMVRGMGAGRRRSEGDAREMGDGSAQPEEWGTQGPRLTRRASLEWACWHLDPALGAGMPCVFDFGNVLVMGNMHDGGSGSGGHRGTMHDYVGWRTGCRGVGLRRVRLRASTGTRRRRGRRWRLRWACWSRLTSSRGPGLRTYSCTWHCERRRQYG